ncbi:unnamed protein product [Lepeophtheirus salmonis]|uniref:(salmon louse) hypothetical protein n=1 Tax=Lepeophtheirus salmonis TaxID=72036 RepID=A0A7R8HDK7_LEPSM|nr:unnamed protein product [Lepeophtheirus salmonis]CAF3036782.1 unnamed protein product [Lepeophtheirus salmonis]
MTPPSLRQKFLLTQNVPQWAPPQSNDQETAKIAISLETSNSSSAEHFTCFSSVTYSCSNLNAYCGESCDPNSFGKLYTKLENPFTGFILLCSFLFVSSWLYDSISTNFAVEKVSCPKEYLPTTLQNEEVYYNLKPSV